MKLSFYRWFTFLSKFPYFLYVMLLRSSVSNEDSHPFRIIGQFCVCQNQPYPCELNSFSVLVRKQARARHVCYDDLMINRSLWILVSLNVFPLQRPELLSWMCSILVVTITVRATRVIPKTTVSHRPLSWPLGAPNVHFL